MSAFIVMGPPVFALYDLAYPDDFVDVKQETVDTHLVILSCSATLIKNTFNTIPGGTQHNDGAATST